MIQKIKNVLKKRKVKLFFLFLLLSTLAWFISNLSNRYQGITTFELDFMHPPDSMMLVSASKETIDVRLDAIGFQFLMFDLSKRKVEIDLSDTRQQGQRYYLTADNGKRQIDKQMASGVRLLDVGIDTLFFEFQSVISKKVPVRPMVNLNFKQNYFLEGVIQIAPDSIVVKGPKNEVGSIQYIPTNMIDLSELNDSFSLSTKLSRSPKLEKTEFSDKEVILSGKVSRFSEKVIRVPVRIINLPKNTQMQTFPDEVDVLVKASVADLKKLRTSEFQLIGDYKSVVESGQKSIKLSISELPSTIHSAELSKKEVDFILKRE